jgi:hypothetical protein
MSEPAFVKIRADEVKPYRWGLWCTVGGGEPHSNPIVSAKWSEDGQRIWFMLDSHNFYDAEPDEVLELVPLGDFWASRPDRPSASQQRRPVPTRPCEHCGGKGHVEVPR